MDLHAMPAQMRGRQGKQAAFLSGLNHIWGKTDLPNCRQVATAIAAFVSIAFAPQAGWACACGCGVFDVGTPAMFPSGAGGMASLEFDFMDQKKNWSGGSRAPADDNEDKEIRTYFYTAGVNYMFDRKWGVDIKMPYWKRRFTTEENGLETFNHASLGDIRISGRYTGFSPDMSTGVEFGVKLPTGRFTQEGFDRDTAIGSGSTDLLIGAFHRDRFGKNSTFVWSVHAKVDIPVLTQGDYRPGTEFNASAVVSHDPYSLGGGFKVAPFLQLVNSYRSKDTGREAEPENSGNERLMIAPGAELSYGATKLDFDVGVPIYQHVRGNQLVAPVLFQVVVSHAF